MELIVLGSGQDGGVPQVLARETVADPRTASSVALVDADRVWLFDVSPDLRVQWRWVGPRRLAGIFLTHGHMGHYAGLVHLGPEAAAVQGVPVHATPTMLTYLDTNEPWHGLFAGGHLRDVAVDGETVPMGGDVRVRATRVPHRAEFTDTVAWTIEAAGRRVLYLPDTDTWDGWDAVGLVAAHDVALVDGTFWSTAEPPGRDHAAVRHPTIRDSLERFADLVPRTRIVFTHLNHSNPAGRSGSPEHAAVGEVGMEIAVDGMRITLEEA